MAGYSGAPLPKKLGIKDGARVARRVGAAHDVILFFVARKDDLERRFGALARSLEPSGGLWIAWPKRVKGPAARATGAVTRRDRAAKSARGR